MKKQLVFRKLKQSIVLKHILYWVLFVLFFGVVWGISSGDYLRNILIQLSCLPSRMLLVYITLLYLFPKFINPKRYFSFFVYYVILVFFISVFVQRPVFLYFIQPLFLPEFQNTHFFVISEITNTALDINIAALIPMIFTYLMTIENLENNNSKLTEENTRLLNQESTFIGNNNDSYISLKVDKSIKKIKINEIEFVESLRNYCRLKMIDSEVMVLKTLTSIEELLPEEKFVRIHRSFLVNKDKLTSFSPSKIEINHMTIPIGRKYKDEVKKKLLLL